MERNAECRQDRRRESPSGWRDDANATVRADEPVRISHQAGRWLVLAALLLTITILPSAGQQSVQNPSPMVDSTRPHRRVSQTEVPGRRIELRSLKGARLFAGPRVDPNKPGPLVVHFHGAPWLIEAHIAARLPKAALITVQLGAGSRAYGQPFAAADLFPALLAEASQALEMKREWSSITLTGFSAGYGAIRAILRHEAGFARVNNVVLLDGIHAGYLPEGKPLADGGTINAADLDTFVKFAREAVAGKKGFVITHSEIFPGTFASTTECVDHVLTALGIRRRALLKEGPMGMQQLSVVNIKRFHVRGYAGNTAPDHVDHLHSMPEWFGLLGIK